MVPTRDSFISDNSMSVIQAIAIQRNLDIYLEFLLYITNRFSSHNVDLVKWFTL